MNTTVTIICMVTMLALAVSMTADVFLSGYESYRRDQNSRSAIRMVVFPVLPIIAVIITISIFGGI